MRPIIVILATAALTVTNCKRDVPPVEESPGGTSVSVSLYPRRTTSGSIAVANLNARVAGAAKGLEMRPDDMTRLASLCTLLLTRADFLGTVSDFDLADDLTRSAVEKHPKSSLSWRTRSKVLAHLHRFDEAEASLAKAESLGMKTDLVARARESIDMAQRRQLQEIRKRRADSAAKRPGYNTHIDVAAIESVLGNYEQADASYQAALDAYRDVSPFAVAWVYFQRGMMWAEQAGQPQRAVPFYREAVARLPAYARAQVHLAELEVETGDRSSAIARLRPLLETADDPEVVGTLGEYLGDDALVGKAKARYEHVLTRHPLAFADHGAEFFMGPGADPKRALELAELNAANRPTKRAQELVARAKEATP